MLTRIIACLPLTVLPLTVAEAQQPGRVYRIGILQSASSEATFIEGFRQGLRELGYVEGKNLALEIRWGEMHRDRLCR
jgi:putative ABC transport system substrate-binding protein